MSNSHPNAHPGAAAYTNAFELAAEFEAAGARAARKAIATVTHYTMLLETKIKANASGRPGPRAKTGDYRRSISGKVMVSGGSVSGTVGTDKPQARRLEYGFVGADSLGRVYDQPPFPHFGPAADEVTPAYAAAVGDIGGLGP